MNAIDFAADRELLRRMRALGVRWRKGRAIPTYSAGMSEQQKREADKLYDAMSEAFIDRQGENDHSLTD